MSYAEGITDKQCEKQLPLHFDLQIPVQRHHGQVCSLQSHLHLQPRKEAWRPAEFSIERFRGPMPEVASFSLEGHRAAVF